MEQNIGLTDQIIRMLIGLAICSLAFIGPQTAWAWLGAPFIFMSAWGRCPIYALLGIKTCDQCTNAQHA